MLRSRFLACSLAAVLMAGCAAPAFQPPAGLDAQVARLMQSAHVPGLALALIDHGQVRYLHAYGLADVAGNTPLRTDHIMYGASLTKAAFAYLCMQLVDEGLIDLDLPLAGQLRRPLPDYPGFADLNADERWRQFTPRMLLSHSSGLLNWRWINPDRKLDIKFPPGSRYVYSGEGIQILQVLVEERSGRPLAELMRERVFDPLGMRNTSMSWRADFAGRTVTHYDADNKALPHEQRSRARAAGSMETTLEDAARLLAAVLRGDRLSRKALDEMLAPQVAIVSPQQFPSHWPGTTEAWQAIRLSAGLGWPLFTSRRGPAFFKEGSDHGTNNLMLGFRQDGSGIVILSNSSNAPRLMRPLLQSLYGETCLPWYWMGYIPYDVELPATAREHPPVSAGCQ